MSRKIIPEEQPKADVQQEVQQNLVTQSVSKIINTAGGEVVITSAELEQIFYEWDATGKNDLVVNDSIAEKIQAYLEYQNILKPLKVKLAEEQFERFLINKGSDGYEYKIYVNSVHVATNKVYSLNGVRSIMYFDDFRAILCFLKNPFAFYAYKEGNKVIDARGWVLEHGGTYEASNDENYNYYIKITMPV